MATVSAFSSHPFQLDTVYDPAAYNTLPSLGKAHSLMTEDVMAKLQGPIRQLFLDHEVQDHYGVCLLDNHFQIPNGQRLVEHGPVSLPWDLGDENKNTAVLKFDGVIAPRSIRLLDGKLAPFEFSFSLTEPQLNSEFLMEAFRTIQDLGLHGVFGVRYFDKHDTQLSVEITQGTANVMIPRGSLSGLIDAFWVFNQDEDDRCHCREQCFPQGGSEHQKNHSCG
ncbi:hypothetical protein VC83_08023 [Pseudogymnoascus destructans]|uniref:Uncharacterized protein n=2 Tax=Pseudogymnoascus destructans TaxID=655981 RepID=L8G4L6_PSED2|nr:uncharacterized protein VC83_08023 [Pseudogymnoascus destructans]ELR08215.1 hypothetical protein GMDG_03025 [Pseudogymnoascus destructans 20631-21]OAF55944.1 hypothetical protein VC83_08023 [Pseudogymnoascus destructans]